MNKKPIVLCIMDGWGLTQPNPGNAVALAKTPNVDRLWNQYPHTTLAASGVAVGLPEGQMGNSEVGHMNLGAGRVVYTGLSLIAKDIADGNYQKQPELLKLLHEVKQRKSKLHVMGLISNGGVHSHNSHLTAFLKMAHDHGVPYYLHGFSDGRDVAPDASLTDFAQINQIVQATGGTWGLVSGRYYAMDRDQRWERTNLVYQALVKNDCQQRFDDVVTYLTNAHKAGTTDEFIQPALNSQIKTNLISDHDVVFFFNFRPDRARQLCHLLKGSQGLYDYQPEFRVKNLYLATMMTYEKIIVDSVIYPPFAISDTLGEIVANHGLKQLRIAETEKYPHVTFFFDGGKEVNLNNADRLLIPSPKVATYDLKPEMSAIELTEKLLPLLPQYDLVILNYANPDMVGHTGVITATIKAVETVDYCVGIITDAIASLGGVCLILADHGNAEVKLDANLKPATSHTANPVPFIVTQANIKLASGGKLGDIAPTILSLLKIAQPAAMSGKNLITYLN